MPFFEIFSEDRHSQEMVYRNIEIALYLVGMQIHSQHSVCAGGHDEIGYKLGRDRVSGLSFSVLPCVPVIRDYGVDPSCRSSLHGVYHYEQLHKIIVYRAASRLNYVHVKSPHRFPDVDRYLSVAEFSHRGLA